MAPCPTAWITSSSGVAPLSSRLLPISSWARSFPGKSAMTCPRAVSATEGTRGFRQPAHCLLGFKHGKAFVGVEDIALHVGGFGGPPPELVHRSHQAHPVQHFLLSAVLDRAQRPLP